MKWWLAGMVILVIGLFVWLAVWSFGREASRDECLSRGLIPIEVSNFHQTVVCIDSKILVVP